MAGAEGPLSSKPLTFWREFDLGESGFENAGVFAGGLAKRFLTRPSPFATALHHYNQEVCIVWRCSNTGIRRVLSGCLGGESFGCRDYRIVELSNWSL